MAKIYGIAGEQVVVVAEKDLKDVLDETDDLVVGIGRNRRKKKKVGLGRNKRDIITDGVEICDIRKGAIKKKRKLASEAMLTDIDVEDDELTDKKDDDTVSISNTEADKKTKKKKKKKAKVQEEE